MKKKDDEKMVAATVKNMNAPMEHSVPKNMSTWDFVGCNNCITNPKYEIYNGKTKRFLCEECYKKYQNCYHIL